MSIAPTAPDQRKSKPTQPPPPEINSESQDEVLGDDTSESNSQNADQEAETGSFTEEEDDDVQMPPPKTKETAATPPARAGQSDNSQKNPSSPNGPQSATPRKAASNTAAADKTGSPATSTGFGLGSLISGIVKVPFDIADQSLKAATKLEELPVLGPAFSLSNGLLRGGLNFAQNLITNPIGTMRTQLKYTGTQMQSHLEKLRSWRQSFGSRSMRFASPGTASDSDTPPA